MIAIKENIVQFGFVFFLVFCFVFLIILGIKLKKVRNKKICFNTASIFIALLIYELFLGATTPQLIKSGSYYKSEEYKTIIDPLLGYSLGNKSFNARAIKHIKDSLAYSAEYNIENGLRSTPLSSDNKDSLAIFLGGSFTFGEGVHNNETLPYFFNSKSNHSYNIINYGFHGYGPHQALAIVEHKIMKDTSFDQAQKKIAVYSFIPDHYRRAAGYSPWDTQGPLYEMESGEITLKGPFNQHKSPLIKYKFFKALSLIFRASHIYKANFSYSEEWLEEKDFDRVYQIFIKINQLLTDKGYDFYIILDPSYIKNHKTEATLISKLNQYNIKYLSGKDCIPNIEKQTDFYYIKYDNHPNHHYNNAIANCFHELISE